jgi:putative component of membrane protein insertase Oxa1/YidC/SpoIIIJ protein YidD
MMKWLLLLIIQIYWLIPKKYRRSCIFKVSCSRYVFEITIREGFINGCRAFNKRFYQCRPGYTEYKAVEGNWILLADKTVVHKSETTI